MPFVQGFRHLTHQASRALNNHLAEAVDWISEIGQDLFSLFQQRELSLQEAVVYSPFDAVMHKVEDRLLLDTEDFAAIRTEAVSLIKSRLQLLTYPDLIRLSGAIQTRGSPKSRAAEPLPLVEDQIDHLTPREQLDLCLIACRFPSGDYPALTPGRRHLLIYSRRRLKNTRPLNPDFVRLFREILREHSHARFRSQGANAHAKANFH